MTPKKIGKNFLCVLLEMQAKRLLKKHHPRIITVAGSVGKTSTKLAIAKLLATRSKVIFQDGNYNDRLTVPLVLFGKQQPGIFNIFAWAGILLSNERTIQRDYPYEVAVLELGPDGPGQLKAFKYLAPDLTLLTAIADEHMEFFKTLDAVATEELVPLSFSKKALINVDDTPTKYLPETEYISYGSLVIADYSLIKREQSNLNGQTLQITFPDQSMLEIEVSLLGLQGAKAVLAAIAVAHILGWSAQDIKSNTKVLSAIPGRMQILAGINDSHIIDDTYNASPIAVKAALDVLYSLNANQRIAILGSMNELGPVSESAHQEIGAYCDPKKLSLVITIGEQAKKYLAPEAIKSGNTVVSFMDPYDAGIYAKDHILPNSVVLAKGSQNGVFAEEAVKVLLADPNDSTKLVRQSKAWINKKRKQFKPPSTT